MPTPANQPSAPLTATERKTADELLTRATCTHPNPVEITTYADPGRQQQAWLCPICSEQWRTVDA